MARKKEAIERSVVSRFVAVDLTDDEKIENARLLGSKTQDLAQAKEKKKEVTKALGAEVEQHQTEVSRLGSIAANGYEYRDVDCEKAINETKGTVTVTRSDTGEIIENRPLRSDERQVEMNLGEGQGVMGA